MPEMEMNILALQVSGRMLLIFKIKKKTTKIS